MKIFDINEEKMKKEGRLTPKELLKNLSAAVDELDTLIYIVRTKEGEIKTGWSESELSSAVGLAECGKQVILGEMWQSE